eukprot:496330-Pleurochrysis_carterae.AAC.1
MHTACKFVNFRLDNGMMHFITLDPFSRNTAVWHSTSRRSFVFVTSAASKTSFAPILSDTYQNVRDAVFE